MAGDVGAGGSIPLATRLTFRFERFVESYIAMWDVLIKRHAEEDLRWHPLMHKS